LQFSRIVFHLVRYESINQKFSFKLLISFEEIGKTCYSPDEFSGQCVELERCQNLMKLRYGAQQSHRTRLYVSLSQCGSLNGNPLVCCTASNYPESVPTGNKNNLQTTPAPPLTQTNRFVTRTTFRPVVARSSECAVGLDNRIFGGSATRIDEMPFIALLEYSKSRKIQMRFDFDC
jgi:hypothetical protein